jgi:hypothetical protein
MANFASANGKHGNGKTYPCTDGEIKYSGNWKEFAGAPPGYECSCCACCVSDMQRERMHLHIYDNRLVFNKPVSPFMCLASDVRCIKDCIFTLPYDQPPFTSGLAPFPCCCIPCTCCGPPVLFTHNPKLCGCIDIAPCFGEQIKAAPCDLCGCKMYLCCGNPCYVGLSVPLATGADDSKVFIAHLKKHVNAFQEKHGMPKNQCAIFQNVSDDLADFGGAGKVVAPTDQQKM